MLKKLTEDSYGNITNYKLDRYHSVGDQKYKTCNGCKSTMPIEFFGKKNGNTAYHCKRCISKERADRRLGVYVRDKVIKTFIIHGEAYKTCDSCKSTMPVQENFYHHRKTAYMNKCIPCFKEHRLFRLSNPESKKKYAEKQLAYKRSEKGRRQRRLKTLKKYGLTNEAYDQLCFLQNNCCAICGRHPEDTKNLNVDHDHKTGKIRGLLCYHCNAVLGWAYDSQKTLQNAIEYLKETQG